MGFVATKLSPILNFAVPFKTFFRSQLFHISRHDCWPLPAPHPPPAVDFPGAVEAVAAAGLGGAGGPGGLAAVGQGPN